MHICKTLTSCIVLVGGIDDGVPTETDGVDAAHTKSDLDVPAIIDDTGMPLQIFMNSTTLFLIIMRECSGSFARRFCQNRCRIIRQRHTQYMFTAETVTH